MELRRLYCLLAVGLLCAGSRAHAAVWVGRGPSQGMYAVVIDPSDSSTLYAGGDSGGVFKSTDSGDNWAPAHNGVPNVRVSALAIDPTNPATVYAGTLGSGVYKTTDGGTSWAPANSGVAGNVSALAIDPASPDTLYAGTPGVGVYKTTSGGMLWTQMNSGLTSTNVMALLVDPTNTNRIYAATQGGGAFKSANGGMSWVTVNDSVGDEYVPLPDNVQALALHPSNPRTVYAGTTGGVFRSFNNSGGNWKAINLGLTTLSVLSLAIDPNGSVLYAGTQGGGIFKTAIVKTDGETLEFVDPKNLQWSPINAGLSDRNIDALAVDPSDPSAMYAAGTAAGVFVHTQLCSAVPQSTCKGTVAAQKSVLTLKDKTNNKSDSVLWKWVKGDAVSVTDFGNPITTDNYSLCIYDESGGTPQLLLGATAPAADDCSGKTPKLCWKPTGTKGFAYKKPARTSDGFDSLTLKAGAAGKAQIVASLKGLAVGMPALPLNLPIHVQLQASNGNCWETRFSTVRKNQSDQFDARSD